MEVYSQAHLSNLLSVSWLIGHEAGAGVDKPEDLATAVTRVEFGWLGVVHTTWTEIYQP